MVGVGVCVMVAVGLGVGVGTGEAVGGIVCSGLVVACVCSAEVGAWVGLAVAVPALG